MRELIQIDGSVLEGGGAIVRIAIALSTITNKPVHIHNIRARRPVAGLRTQHLEGIKAVTNLCQGKLANASIGSKEIEFYPSKITEKEINIQLSTAASIGLVLQPLLIASLKIREKLEINIEGGSTFSKWSPPVPYLQYVLLPILRKMGYNMEINILQHGFYPSGNAKVKVIIYPCETLKPINFVEQGEIKLINSLSIASKHLKKPKVAERQARTVEKILLEKGYDCNIRTKYVDSVSIGSGIVLYTKTFDTILGSDSLGERGKPAEQVGREAVERLLKTIESKATVDEHLGDQLLPFMALAKGKSIIIAPNLTLHAKTNIWVIKKFLPVEFSIRQQEKNVRIEYSGL